MNESFINRLFEMKTEFYRRINQKLIEFIDLSKVIKSAGYLIKKSYFFSVDFTEIYSGHMNIIRYLINWIHFILINCCFLIILTFIVNDNLYSLIDNEFLSKNAKSIFVAALLCLTLTISFRFDVLINEWNHHLKGLKFIYYLQENLELKHGLTKRNKFKLSLLTKFIEFVAGFFIASGLTIGSIIYLYLTFRSGRIMLFISYPLFIYLFIYLFLGHLQMV